VADFERGWASTLTKGGWMCPSTLTEGSTRVSVYLERQWTEVSNREWTKVPL
jgi:hypothetical protein